MHAFPSERRRSLESCETAVVGARCAGGNAYNANQGEHTSTTPKADKNFGPAANYGSFPAAC
jgi:hypothetical protein